MSEQNHPSNQEINPELEANISKKVDGMKEIENEESKEIDFDESTDISGGLSESILWEIKVDYKTDAQ